MSERFNALLSPLHFAAYLAWGAIGWELLVLGSSTPAWLHGAPPTSVLALMHASFLVLFLVNTGGTWSNFNSRAMVLAQLALAFAIMGLARNSSVPILLILCVVQVVQVWSPRAAVLLMLVMNLAIYGLYALVWRLESPLITTVMHLSFQAFAGLTSWFAFSAGRARDALAATNADLLATRFLLAETARDSERLRLSRELHDVAGHKLTALKINLATLVRDPRFVADEQVRLCARLADELLADIRGVVQQMRRDDGLDLGDALQALAAPFPRPRLHLQIAPNARVATVVQAEAVLRAVQESLTNAVRHSQAQNLWVVLDRQAGELKLDIRDDGRGHGDIALGNGLTGMRERLEAVGGGLHVGRTDTGGVRVQAWLPAAA